MTRRRARFWSGAGQREWSPSDQTIEARIGKRVEINSDGCWIYDGDPDGYGHTTKLDTSGLAHRLVYQSLVGPIDEGCHVHHTCLTPGCCNPEHLIVLTPKEHRAEHSRLRQANRPPRSYQPDKRVGGKRRKGLPVFKLDPATGKYRKVG